MWCIGQVGFTVTALTDQRSWVQWHTMFSLCGGIGPVGAARLLNRHGSIEKFPPAVLGERLDQALLFKRLATLRRDAPLFDDVEQLRWQGATERFAGWTQRMGAPRLLERCLAASTR